MRIPLLDVNVLVALFDTANVSDDDVHDWFVHQLGLAIQHGGKLATFDRSIPLKAVPGATKEHMEFLGTRS